MRSRLIVAAALAGLVSAAHGGSAPDALDSPPADRTVIGKVSTIPITADDIVGKDPAAFEHLQQLREQQAHELELQYRKAYHELLSRNLTRELDRRALELESADRHVPAQTIIGEITTPDVTDEQVRAFYDARKARTDQPFEQLQASIRQYLADQQRDAAMRTFYDGLREKHHVKDLLGPYRISVAATGPVRGNAAAPVTIIEFGDFQCPYCRHAESGLRSLIAHHANEIRLVFRHLPLTELHPNARLAAIAAVCADQQGKFWEMHDALFADRTALGVDALKSTAARVGLDGPRFAGCLDGVGEDSATAVVDMDAKAAMALGIHATPYFFVDGRPLAGEVSADQFETIIAEELQRLSTGR